MRDHTLIVFFDCLDNIILNCYLFSIKRGINMFKLSLEEDTISPTIQIGKTSNDIITVTSDIINEDEKTLLKTEHRLKS